MKLAALTLLPVLPLAAAAPMVDFTRQVHPILARRCFTCHSGDKRFGGLSLGTYADLIQGGSSGRTVDPGSAAGSLLLRRVLGDGVPAMPPVGDRLTAEEIGTLRAWIEQGARPAPGAPPAPRVWKPTMVLSAPPLPDGEAAHPVDRWLGEYFRARSIQPPPVVGDAAFARRAYYDVWGLPPSPEEIDAFLASPSRPALVRKLLAHRRNYAEHWITFWNDLLRNDEGVNYAGTRKSITGWLRKALENNVPYNEFAARLLNPAATGDPDGFLLGVNWRGDISASQTPAMQAAQNSAQVFLGVNLKCNSCHDSFISKWKLKDAYGLASFFSAERLEIVRCDVRTGQYATPRFLFPELGGVSAEAALPERRAAAARLFTAAGDGRFARTIVNRVWDRLTGRGLVVPVDDMDAEPWHPQLLDWLSASFAANGYDLQWLIGTILTSQAYQLPAGESGGADEAFVFRGPAPRRLTAEQFIDTISAITGEWRVRVTDRGRTAEFSREWRLAASPLTRALGRPIRDQVFTQRNDVPSTLQALELVNGGGYASYLLRAAKSMLGVLPEPAANLFDSALVSSGTVRADIDITGLRQLRLVVQDVDSYSPERVRAVWAAARLTGPGIEDSLPGAGGPAQMKNGYYGDALRVKTPSETVIGLAGKGYTRFRAYVGVEEECVQSDISPRIRFFVFDRPPDPERLVRVEGGPPAPRFRGAFTADTLIRRVYRHALGRHETPEERKLARALLAGNQGIQPEGLADLLWTVALLPEFQYLQ